MAEPCTHSRTLKALAGITDTGLFELLATAVLREANPVYEPLVHTGVNAQGKTIKGPVDGVMFIAESQPPHMISVHHTTGDRDKLEKKWLHDPATVKHRKTGAKASAPGDILKTIEIYKEERKRTPDLVGTLVLTVTSDPPQDLVREAEAQARNAGIGIDLWPASRIAHFLDTQPFGQWIRRQHLGIEQELLSSQLLGELSKKNLEANRALMFAEQAELWVSRDLDSDIDQSSRQPLSLLVGESGTGKSVACIRQLDRHLNAGGFGLVVPHGVIGEVLTLDEAIFQTLGKVHPTLHCQSPPASAYASPDQPLLILIEDVNRSARPQDLIEKVLAWGRQAEKGAEKSIRILCPVWPRYVANLLGQRKKEAEAYLVLTEKFSAQEGEAAVIKKAALSGSGMSKLSAREVSEALGHDPLLIALHDFEEFPRADAVIESYIHSALLKAETADDVLLTASDYLRALQKLAKCMLSHKQIEVLWRNLTQWEELDDGAIKAINALARQGQIISYSGDPGHQVLLFRHDRIRDWVLSKFLTNEMTSGVLEQYVLTDPFYAELMGRALVDAGLDQDMLDHIYRNNPLSLFYALKHISGAAQDQCDRLVTAINTWLRAHAHQSRAYRYLRWRALQVLSESDSPVVPDIVNLFSGSTIHGHLARLRNGDLAGGINLCYEFEPGTGFTKRDVQIEHAKHTYGNALTRSLQQVLTQDSADRGMRIGALRLAGHIADGRLAEAIWACWTSDDEKEKFLADYLWAFAQCWAESSEDMLDSVMDVWAALPEERKGGMPSPREEVAAFSLRFSFRRWPPEQAIAYFIRRASSEALHWPIFHLFQEMNDPRAIAFVVKELAKEQRRVEGTDQHSLLLMSEHRNWERALADDKRSMSIATRQVLFDLWRSPNNDKYTRKQAFLIWAAPKQPIDLDILREPVDLLELQDYLLIERLKRGDQEAIPQLVEKLNDSDPAHWWQYGRYVWSAGLSHALDQFLESRRDSVPHEYFNHVESDWVIGELISERPEIEAERLLTAHWDHLRYSQDYVQAALYIASSDSLKLAKQAIAECPNPEEMLKHLNARFGIKFNGRLGITTEKQISALVPYLDYLSELSVNSLWEVCNEKGWFDLRRRHIDRKLSGRSLDRLWGEHRAREQLDDMVCSDRRFWMDNWVDEYMKTGVFWGVILDTLVRWLEDKPSEDTLEVVADAVAHKGSRTDVERLQSYERLNEEAADILRDCRYRVYSLRLH